MAYQQLGVGQVGPNPIPTNRVGTTTQNAFGRKKMQMTALKGKLAKASATADRKLVD